MLQYFFPSYFESYRNLDIAISSNVTGLIMVSGIFAGIVCGLTMGVVGLRRIFIWPFHGLILLGCMGAILFQPGLLLYISVGLIGFGQGGRAPAVFTIPMEIEGMTPAMVGASYSLIFGLGNGAAFVSPIVAGWLASYIGLYVTLSLFAFIQIVPLICTYLLPETGPGGRNKPISE